MKALIAALAFATLTACGPRNAEVKTGPQPVSEVSLHVTNNLSQAVNVYVTTGGSDVFLKQVAANSSTSIVVPGVPSGATVKLKATSADGAQTYSLDNVTTSRECTTGKFLGRHPSPNGRGYFQPVMKAASKDAIMAGYLRVTDSVVVISGPPASESRMPRDHRYRLFPGGRCGLCNWNISGPPAGSSR